MFPLVLMWKRIGILDPSYKCRSGSEIKLAFMLNASGISKCEAKMLEQEIFRECKSIDQNIESQICLIFCCVKSSNLRINQFILSENKTKRLFSVFIYFLHVKRDEILQHFIWIFTVCQSRHLEVFSIHRANSGIVQPIITIHIYIQ